MTHRPFEAIIFDHDGTLIDTETPDFEACKMLFAEYNLPLTIEYWAKYVVGRMDGYDIMFNQILQNNGNGPSRDQLWRRYEELWPITFNNIQLMPGVVTLLDTLQAANYPLAVATASDTAWVTRWLNQFGLHRYFQVVANSDHITNNKPAPDVYLHAAQQLGVAPEQCLVFEDSVAGLQAAKAANMTAVAVPSHVTQSLDFSQADTVIHGLQDVTLDWIKQLVV